MKNSMLLNSILSLGFSLSFFYSGHGQHSKIELPSVSREVFESIAQFYNYDKDIPLEAKIVGQQDFSYSNREKIIFREQIPAAFLLT